MSVLSALDGVPARLVTNLRSPRVLLTLLLVAAVSAAAALLARRVLRRRGWVVVAAALPVVVATAVLVAPYFTPRELDEALPAPAGVAPATGTASAPPSVAPATAALRGLGGHRASGRVELHRLADGRVVLRFADVDVEGTPTPRVYVVPGAGRERPGGQSLGALRAEKGSFNYSLTTDPARPVTVLVWCERFAVPIAGATFAA